MAENSGENQESDLTSATLALTASLWHQGLIKTTDRQEVFSQVEEALKATVRHIGEDAGEFRRLVLIVPKNS